MLRVMEKILHLLPGNKDKLRLLSMGIALLAGLKPEKF
jgi:hypothetical protein